MKKIVYVLGAGRSGSTVLDRILGSHPSMISTGELGHLSKYVPLQTGRGSCSCGKSLSECDMYGNIPFLRDIDCDLVAIKKEIFDYIFRYKDGIQAIIESSKSPERLSEIFNLNSSKYEIKVIFLTRDVRGVSYSISRKRKNIDGKKRSVLRSTLSWYFRNLKSLKILRKVDRKDKLHITYEQFASETIDTIEEICLFIGIPFESEMLNYGKKEQHLVDGNYLARVSKDSVVERDLDYITKVRPWELILMTLVAGRLNYKFMNKLLDI